MYSINLDPDPNWAQILDPDRYSMYLDPQHWLRKNVAPRRTVPGTYGSNL